MSRRCTVTNAAIVSLCTRAMKRRDATKSAFADKIILRDAVAQELHHPAVGGTDERPCTHTPTINIVLAESGGRFRQRTATPSRQTAQPRADLQQCSLNAQLKQRRA